MAKVIKTAGQTSQEIDSLVEEVVTEPTVVEETKVQEVVAEKEIPTIPDTEEVAFLKRIYRIQNDGCFGTHLNSEILDRINQLQSK